MCRSRQNLRDMRENNWVARREVEGPKKITDVHEDAKREVCAYYNPDVHPDLTQDHNPYPIDELHLPETHWHAVALAYLSGSSTSCSVVLSPHENGTTHMLQSCGSFAVPL